MANWQNNMVNIVRSLIFDLTPPYRYSDTRIEELIVVGAVLTVQEVRFDTTYTVDNTAVTITPDPSGDEDFVALVSLKTACLITMGERRDFGRNAVSIKDGPSTIDTTDRAKQFETLSKDICKKYEEAKRDYLIGDGSLGRSIVGPYNVYYDYRYKNKRK